MAKQSSTKTPKKKREPAPPPQTEAHRTFTHALGSLREGAYAVIGCAVIAGVLMLLHMRPFG